jgi:hypothetical protein
VAALAAIVAGRHGGRPAQPPAPWYRRWPQKISA